MAEATILSPAIRALTVGFGIAACGRINFDVIGDGDGLTYREAVIQDAPLAYWRLGDTEGVARDEMGLHDAPYSGTCGFGLTPALAGDPDRSTSFDGTSCQIDLGNQFAFPGTMALSIEMWIAPAGGGVIYQHLFTRQVRSAGPVDGYALLLSTATEPGLFFERSVAMVETQTLPHIPLTPNVFAHAVVTYDGARANLYIDGALAGSGMDSRNLAAVAANAYIGSVPEASPHFFVGRLDEVAIYGSVLPLDRIQLHHAIGVSGPQ